LVTIAGGLISRPGVGHHPYLLGGNSLGRPFRMNLKTSPLNVEIEFRFELLNNVESDVAERADEVRKHHDFKRHIVLPISL
jgi:hypothetical protein